MTSVRNRPIVEVPKDIAIDEAMRTVCECIPQEILSNDGVETLLMHTGHLPVSALEDIFFFESHLDDVRARCDFSVFVYPESNFGRYLIEKGNRKDATASEEGLSTYLSEVARPESFLSRWFEMSILEYEMTGSASCSPGVYLEGPMGKQHGHPLVRRTRGRRKFGNPGVLISAICAAVGWEEDIAEREAAEALFDALPMNVGCWHAGAFPSREPRSLRFIFSMSHEDCGKFLETIRWGTDGAIRRFHRIASDVGPLMGSVSLSCDVTAEGVSSRMGFELYLNRPWGLHTAKDWIPLLDYFRRNSLGLPEKLDALHRWPSRELIFWGEDVASLLIGINHFKVVLDRDCVQLKSYVGARFVSV